jgi:hypothetical protein
MAYIGKTPVIGNFQKCDSISVVNGQAAYTLQVGGANVSPQSENHMLVSLNGILQAPVDSFTVSGSTLTFVSNLITGDVIDFVMILGNVLDLGVPSDNTISTAKLQANAVTSAKMFSTFKNGITEIDTWRVTADFSGTGYVTANWERDDTYGNVLIGTGISESSGVFTFPSTGVYQINFGSRFTRNLVTPYAVGEIQVTTDNSSYNTAANSLGNVPRDDYYDGFYIPYIFDVTDTSTHKVKFYMQTNNTAVSFGGNTDRNFTYANFIRLGDT